MTQLLVSDYREPPDCDYVWATDPPIARNCAVHACVIQWGHSHPCLCGRCGAAAWKPHANLPTKWSWTGYLDECVYLWPRDDAGVDSGEPGDDCVATNPSATHHMCVDGDDSVSLGHETHLPDVHTCRCGARTWLTERS